MSEVIDITISEFENLVGDDAFEIVSRDSKARFRKYTKYLIRSVTEKKDNTISDAANNFVNNINAINNSLSNVTTTINNIASLGKLNIFLSATDLCVSVVGFVIISNKLNSISHKIDAVLENQRKIYSLNSTYKYDEVLSEYSDMLDGIKTGKEYSEEEYRKLIDNEYNVLKLLYDSYINNLGSNEGDLLLSIVTLSAMLSNTIVHFDRIYYFNHKDSITSGSKWHNSHDKWTNIYDSLTSKQFANKLYDYAFMQEKRNQHDAELFKEGIFDKIKFSKEAISQSQEIIIKTDDLIKYKKYNELMNQLIKNDIESAISSLSDEDREAILPEVQKVELELQSS